jgi:hypothetical protein
VRRGTTPTAFAASLAALVLLTGCSDGPATASAESNARAEAVMAEAEAATTVPPSTAPAVRVGLDESAARSIAGAPTTITTTLSVDDAVGYEIVVQRPPTGDAARISVVAPQGGSVELVLVGADVFVGGEDLPGGATWVRMDRDEVVDTVGIDPVVLLEDPIAVRIAQVAEYGGRREPIGAGAALDGPTSMYRFSANVRGLVDEADAWGLLDGIGPAVPLDQRATVECLADAQGRLVQVSYDQTIAQDGHQRTVRVVDRYSGFGQPADVAAPAAEDTISLDELLAVDPAAAPQRS